MLQNTKMYFGGVGLGIGWVNTDIIIKNIPYTVIEVLFHQRKKSILLNVIIPAGNYVFKVINRNTRTRREARTSHWRRSGVFIVNLERISHLVLVFL